MKRICRNAAVLTMISCGIILAPGCAGEGGERPAKTDGPSGELLAQQSDVILGEGEIVLYACGRGCYPDSLTSVDGWTLEFDQVLVTVADIEAIRTDPPWIPKDGPLSGQLGSVGSGGPHTLDLVGGEVFVDAISDAPAGLYNALAWSVIPASDTLSEGYSIILGGTATKTDTVEGTEIVCPFKLRFDHTLRFTGGENQGRETRGLLEPDGSADLEMTFHLDRLFGDASLPEDDPVNGAAPGFDLFASFMEEGAVDTDLEFILSSITGADSIGLVDALAKIGHIGDAECLSERLD